MLEVMIAAAAIGGCPKPLPRKHKLVNPPLCMCVSDPRPLMLAPPELDPLPVELNVVTYYVPFTSDEGPDDYPSLVGIDGLGPMTSFGGVPSFVQPVQPAWHAVYTMPSRVAAPELDVGSLPAGLTVLFGGIAVLRGRRLCVK